MDGEQKKISFSFNKSSKFTKLVNPVKEVKEAVQYVDAFDAKRGKFSYKGIVREEEKKAPLVIPLIGTRTAYDVIKAKLEDRDKATDDSSPKEEPVTIKMEPHETSPGPVEEKENDVKPSLELLAAKEILDGLHKNGDGKNGTDSGKVIVPDMEKPTFTGEKESTLEDYENVPVDDYGLALLRGMGWTPQTGIGKDSKIVQPVTSKLRPKRLGLGAEGSMLPPGERPPLKRGVFVQIMSGVHKNSVGVVEGTDGDTGSVVVKVDGLDNLSLSEHAVNAISKKEYEKLLNGVTTNPPEEKKYGINEVHASQDRSIKRESDNRNESNVRSASRSPDRKKRKDYTEEKYKSSKDEVSSKRERRRRSESSSPDRRHRRRDKNSRRSDHGSKDSNRGKKDRSDRSDSSSLERGRKRSSGRTHRRSNSDDDASTYKKKSSKLERDSEASESNYHSRRSTATDKSKKIKKDKKRSHSRERHSTKEKNRRDSNSEDEVSTKKSKKHKKKSKRSRKNSESSG